MKKGQAADTIAAISTASGVGAISIIRLSGSQAIPIVAQLFSKKSILQAASHTLHVGTLIYENQVLDEVVVGIYRNPKSFTGEDVVEISCHGSPFIQAQIIQACTAKGARIANPGEFTQRAFLNGKMDLTQAEAVADVIATETEAQHKAALHQLKGGFSKELNELREELIHFSALLELELDFSEEDVEFADRKAMTKILSQTSKHVQNLLESFAQGNAIKNGIAVAIIGAPNAGKSSLLNALLNDERAIVSPTAGTTRDTIEEFAIIRGIQYRFIDTAGLRSDSTDQIELLGIERSKKAIAKADLVLFVQDDNEENLLPKMFAISKMLEAFSSKSIWIRNKIDLAEFIIDYTLAEPTTFDRWHTMSAKSKEGVKELKEIIYELTMNEPIHGTIITNSRHKEALEKILASLKEVENGFSQNISTDLISVHLRAALHYIGTLTGAVQHDRDILGTIFSKFCIGK